jgi:MFS family permease
VRTSDGADALPTSSGGRRADTLSGVRRRLAPLGLRPFGRLLTSYTVNELGDSIGVVALSLLVFDATGEIAPTAGFFLVAKFLPALLAPALTARLDQVDPRRALPTLYVLEAGLFAALALIAGGTFSLPLVLLLGLLDGVLAITGRGLTRGAVGATLQPAGLLKEGNALLNLGFALASVGGAALAGVLVAKAGLETALFVDALSFLVIAGLLATARDLRTEHVEPVPWRENFALGLQFARRHATVRLLLIGQALALVCFTLIVPIEVVYAKESLGTTSAGFGALLSAWGAGIVLGSVVYLGVRHRSALGLILLSSAAIGVAYLGMAAAQALWVACGLSVLGGTGNGIQWVAVMTGLQEATPPHFQARITGFLESIGAALPGVGYLIGAVIAALVSPRAAYAVAGAGVLALVVTALALRARFPSGLAAGGGGRRGRLASDSGPG